MSESRQTVYEVFLSYSRRDNQADTSAGWVTQLRDRILADHRRFSTEPLRIFFDTHPEDGIQLMDDWRHRILGALRSSKILLVCLSPNYFSSEYCRWEWEEYSRRQVHQQMGGDSIATVYFVEVPGQPDPRGAAQLAELLRGNYLDLRPWYPHGPQALQDLDVQRRVDKLSESLWERIQRRRRAERVPGNLRRQSPYFVGRREELRSLHESLGVGAIGVVTAVHGLGGIGKTELAVAYAHAFADHYPGGLWIVGAEGKHDLLPLIGELAFSPELRFSATEAQKADPTLLGRAVLAELQRRAMASPEQSPVTASSNTTQSTNTGRTLLILDNVSEPALLSPTQISQLPRVEWLSVLATTRLGDDRLREARQSLALVPLDSLHESDALALIREHQPEQQFASAEEESAALDIVRTLGGFTLAIEQVAVYLALHPSVRLPHLRDAIQQGAATQVDSLAERLRTQGRDGDIQHREKLLGIVLDATLAALVASPAGDLANCPELTAVQFAALFPPDVIPWSWLRQLTLTVHPELRDFRPEEPDPWLIVRRRLTGLRLLTNADHPELARMHRLISDYLRHSQVSSIVASSFPRAILDRALAVVDGRVTPSEWEWDALAATVLADPDAMPLDDSSRLLALAAIDLSEQLKSYRSLGQAAGLLGRAQRYFERLSRSQPGNLVWQFDVAIAAASLGDLAEAQGDISAAEKSHGNAVQIVERLLRSEPSHSKWQFLLANSYGRLGDLAQIRGRLSEATRFLNGALRIITKLRSGNRPDVDKIQLKRTLARLLDSRGRLAIALGNRTEAVRDFTDCVQLIKSLHEQDMGNPDWMSGITRPLICLGDLALDHGDAQKAYSYFNDVVGIRHKLSQRDPANTTLQSDLAQAYGWRGSASFQAGRIEDARGDFREYQRLIEALIRADSSNSGWQRELSIADEKLGDVCEAEGDLAGAESHYRQSLQCRQRLSSATPHNAWRQQDLAIAFEKLAEIARAGQRFQEAATLFEETNRIRGALAAADPENSDWQRAIALCHYKQAFLAQEQHDSRGFANHLRECFLRLHRLREQGVDFTQDMRAVYEQIASIVSSEGEP